MTILGQKTAAAIAATPPKSETLFARARAQNPRGEFVVLPLFGRAWIELAGEMTVNEIEGAVFADMKRLDLAPTALNAFTYDNHRMAHTLAWAVREPDKREERFGTLDEWLALDIDMICACGIVYSDVRERLDPMGVSTLTKDDIDGIRYAIEKKNPILLRSYGVAKLSLWLLTGGVPPASSPTPPSTDGPS